MDKEELGRVGLLLRQMGGVTFDDEGRIVVADRETREAIRSHFEGLASGAAARASNNTKCIAIDNGYCPKTSPAK
ncbi:MAG TPA: hypothetical protein VGB79_09640 [Allosphingosinicella sp.]|jgi:hypothetical protein